MSRFFLIIKYILALAAVLFFSACATTKIKVVDDSTGESISDAFVYIKPMHLLPFCMGKLNILKLSDKDGNVFTPDSSFYLYAAKRGYGLTSSCDYNSEGGYYLVRLKREGGIKRILFNGSESELESLKNCGQWKRFVDYCDSCGIVIEYAE